MMSERNIIVQAAQGIHIDDQPVEIVERKGLGHPDSLCDGIAREISREYSRWCKENLGLILHHNFDKVQLVAGESRAHFGGGEMIKPIRIQIAGRGTREYQGRTIPVDTLAIATARKYLKNTLRYLDVDANVVIDCFAGTGSTDLTNTVDRIKANDTSFGVAHWPHSSLEEIVYETSQYLNNLVLKMYPIGEDTKVMGCRNNGTITLTCSIPFIAAKVKTPEEYLSLKRELVNLLQRFAQSMDEKRKVEVMINNADNPQNNDYYLTVTGTSAECGDDGQVGRGNRVTGFIAPFRPSSLEAACGKNAISHVGVIYNVLALETARKICETFPEVTDVSVYILSQIGSPLDQPLLANVTARTKNGNYLEDGLKGKIHEFTDRAISEVEKIREVILSGQAALF